MHQTEHPAEKGRTTEHDVLAPLLEPLLDPADSLEPHQLGRTRRVGDRRDETLLGARPDMPEARDADL